MDDSLADAVLVDAAMSPSSYSEVYPTPAGSEKASSEAPQDPPKKKRKAWGQPVPEIKQILPPRKRAKTAEEKEQRKNERILRNRRAADKSRQRQKAAVAELEAKQGRIEVENSRLRAILAQYQSRFGVQADFPSIPDEIDLTESSAMTPQPPVASPFTPASFDNTPDVELQQQQHQHQEQHQQHQQQPTLVLPDTSSLKHESPALAPTLNLIHEHSESEPSALNMYQPMASVSGMTQYPAVVLCDLQCQPETLAIKLPTSFNNQKHLGLSTLLRLFQTLMIFQAFSTTTLLPICSLFQILAQRLSMTSTERDFSSILNNFPLIHCLISMPSTPTRPAVFRTRFLSRLLACSPHMARLLLAATTRALQRVVSQESFVEDPDLRWTWSSLMTIKWNILRLEREHRKIRHQVRTVDNNDRGFTGVEAGAKVMAGVDYRAVARSSQLWQGKQSICTIRDEVRMTAQEVH